GQGIWISSSPETCGNGLPRCGSGRCVARSCARGAAREPGRKPIKRSMPGMNPKYEEFVRLPRRHFFGRAATGIGVAALASLLNEGLTASERETASGLPHFKPKAKRVIYL